MGKTKQDKFLELYEPVHEKFERFCRARVYGDMEYSDLMNETLLRAYEKFDLLYTPKAFLSFLFSISVRVLANAHRKKKPEYTSSEELNNVIDINSSADKDAEVFMLYKALSLLREDQRECIILFEISGFSIKEIAKIQNTSLSSVKQRLRKGRLKLQEVLINEYDEQREEVMR